MNDELELDLRVSQPDWFRAPSNMDDFCIECGQHIQHDETIAEIDSDEGLTFVHATCFYWKLEDQIEVEEQVQ